MVCVLGMVGKMFVFVIFRFLILCIFNCWFIMLFFGERDMWYVEVVCRVEVYICFVYLLIFKFVIVC